MEEDLGYIDIEELLAEDFNDTVGTCTCQVSVKIMLLTCCYSCGQRVGAGGHDK